MAMECVVPTGHQFRPTKQVLMKSIYAQYKKRMHEKKSTMIGEAAMHEDQVAVSPTTKNPTMAVDHCVVPTGYRIQPTKQVLTKSIYEKYKNAQQENKMRKVNEKIQKKVEDPLEDFLEGGQEKIKNDSLVIEQTRQSTSFEDKKEEDDDQLEKDEFSSSKKDDAVEDYDVVSEITQDVSEEDSDDEDWLSDEDEFEKDEFSSLPSSKKYITIEDYYEVPTIKPGVPEDSDNEDWLFKKKTKNQDESRPEKRLKSSANEDGVSNSSSSLWQPRAQYLSEVDIYALPYTIPY